MSTEDTPAAVAGPFVLPPEDQLGMSIADVLRENFDASRRLLQRCEVLAGAETGDAVNAINAASRLLRSNAQMAFGAARVSRIEQRRRTITEKAQPPVESWAELNSKKLKREEELRAEIEQKIQRIELAREGNQAHRAEEKNG